MQVVATADVAVADEDLRHGAPAAARLHLGAFLGRRFDVVFGVRDALAREQLLRARAVRAPARRVDDDRGRVHHAALATGRFSARQPLKPPRSVNAFVKPWACNWRTAAADSEPES